MKEITVSMFVTEDGCEFRQKECAELHEKHLEMKKAIQRQCVTLHRIEDYEFQELYKYFRQHFENVFHNEHMEKLIKSTRLDEGFIPAVQLKPFFEREPVRLNPGIGSNR